ncbi:hypothetical protein AGMMS50284_7530 [Clostridia bacterium]|nr:hypothetical protein AGMMS50284_7530 [Clostridia bacterium]
MKKIISILLAIIIMTTVCACDLTKPLFNRNQSSENNEKEYNKIDSASNLSEYSENELHKFTFNEYSCNAIFGGSPDNVFEGNKKVKSRWNYIKAESNGKIYTVWLTDKQFAEWKTESKKMITETVIGANSKVHTHVEVGQDYKSFIYDGYDMGFELGGFVVGCALLQVLTIDNGNGDDWSIDITFRNYDTKNIVWHGTLPGDTFNLSPNDWKV